MSKSLKQLSELKNDLGYWGERIIYELEYAYRISKVKDLEYKAVIEETSDFVLKQYQQDKVITEITATKAEDMLAVMKEVAKSYKMICAAHAHIDMNWMWRWDETVSITIDTMKTMLNLMEDYPQFTFSQSQASVYKIIEDYAPCLLEDIKKRVKEGRWEITASTWVEGDKNLPNGESLARHILYTKKYLSNLLDINPDSLNFDFEPDTFGHAATIPEILAKGGVKYYYFCRGQNDYNLFNWIAPSGESIIAYREPVWYNGEIEPYMALYLPEFCKEYGLDTMLKVYGVGDHGGGPTRRDLERFRDMSAWPIYPELRFGTYNEYFKLVDKIKDQLPTFRGELNFIQSGCYTSQSRVKYANRLSENTLNEAETFSTISTLSNGAPYNNKHFAEAWQNTLFIQFHDIIPGSCTLEPKEHAMGLFQETLAKANSQKKFALENILKQIDTNNLINIDEKSEVSRSEGAGVGFGSGKFRFSQCERGRGKERIFHVFNSAPYEREETVELTLWDWKGDIDLLEFKGAEGEQVEYQLLDMGFNNYWNHDYLRVLIKSRVPACGYKTYVMTEVEEYKEELYQFPAPRVEQPDNDYILENDYIKVVVSHKNGAITSIYDKEIKKEYIDFSSTAGIFRYIEEDNSKKRTSWVVGRHMNVVDLTENVKISKVRSGKVRQSIKYDIQFKNSKLTAEISLDYDSPEISFDVKCDWREIAVINEGVPEPGYNVNGKFIPQLNFYLPFNYDCDTYKYDIPFGIINRNEMELDVPGNSFIAGVNKNNEKSMMLVTDSKYGFRGNNNSIAVTLIRSSYNPDPYPEFGIHSFSFALKLVENSSNKELIKEAYNYNHNMDAVSGTVHKGSLPTKNSFIQIKEGNIAVSAIKIAEDYSNRLILRVYETEGKSTMAVLNIFKEVKSAYYVDINESKIDTDSKITINGKKLSFNVESFNVASICLEF